MRQLTRCLFCGALAGDGPLVANLHNLVCSTCYSAIGELFAVKEPTTPRAPAMCCLSCGRGPSSRRLVAGVAAAICRPCHAGTAARLMPLAPQAVERATLLLGSLPTSRVKVRRARKQHRDAEMRLHSKRRLMTKSAIFSLMLKEQLAARRIKEHLVLQG